MWLWMGEGLRLVPWCRHQTRLCGTWLLVATVEANMSSPPALGLPPAVKQNGSLGRAAAAAAAARTTISVQLSGGGSPQPCCCTTTIRGDSGHRVG